MRNIFGCFIFLMVMITSLIFAGTVYYVDATNGNDSNNGTSPSTPWQTISKVNSSSFSAGDFILFKCGEVWRETLYPPSSGFSANPITFGKYGSGNNPIINGSDLITGWTLYSGNVWQATCSTDPRVYVFFDGTKGEEQSGIGSLTSEYDWYWSGGTLYVYSTSDPDTAYTSPGIEAPQRNCVSCSSNYVVIDGIDVKYSRRSGIMFDTSADPTVKNLTASYAGKDGVFLLNCTGILVNNVRATQNLNSGINAMGCSGGTISYCDSGYNNLEGKSVSGWGGHGIDIVYSTYLTIEHNKCHHSGTDSGIAGDEFSYNTIQYNEVYNNKMAGIDMSSGVTFKCEYNIVRYNLVYNNIGAAASCGILLYTHETEGSETRNNEVYYNILYGNTFGIRIKGYANYNEIYNNVLYQNGVTNEISIYYEGSVFPMNNTIKNNIIYRGIGRFVRCDSSTGNNTLDYNFYYPEGSGCFKWEHIGYNTLSGWQAASGQDANSINSDPLFVGTSNDNFTLKIDSLCIDAGTFVGLTEDYAGNSVPAGWAVDIGAYEYTGASPLDAEIDASPTYGEVALTVNFKGSATGGVLPYSYSWDFGDGTSSSEQNPTYTYNDAGDHIVTLTVTDSENNQDNDSLTISTSPGIPYLSCSPTSLYFGASTSGNETSDQYLRIINAGSGILTWNIEDDADWLSCSPSSGTDRGEITVSVSASGLSLGRYTATITVSSPQAYNSPQYVSVNLRVYEPEQENPPFGSRDTPVEGRLRVGIKEVRTEYRPQVDDERNIHTKSILKIQIEEMEPLRIVLEEGSGGNMKYIGWGENKANVLPIGSTLDREKGIFSWIPTPGFIGRYVLHFAVTDGLYMSKPLRVFVNVIPKSHDRD